MKMDNVSKAYAAYVKNNEILSMSSSGGIFYVLAKWTIKNNGIVYGVDIDKFGKVAHKRVCCLEELHTLLTSKYVQSDLGQSFVDCKNDLAEGRLVLFSGTPCQIYALQNYLSNMKCQTKSLITCDIVCHGTPNKIYWNLYINYLKNKNLIEEPLNVNFRFKKPRWEHYSLKINKYIEDSKTSKYMRLFLDNYSLCSPCYKCNYKGTNHYSDITLGDFWGVNTFYKNYYNKDGTSLVIIHSTHNKNIIYNLLKKECSINEVNLSISTLFNDAYWESVKIPKDYDIILEKFDFAKYNPRMPIKTFKNKLINIPRSFINKHLISYSQDTVKRKKVNKKKIGIISLYANENFGNKLQNYALIITLQHLGYDPYNIILSKYAILGRFVLFLLKKIKITNRNSSSSKREYAIEKASKKYEKRFFFFYSKKLKRKLTSFATILFGSDQIWYDSTDDLLFRFGNFGLTDNCCPKKVAYAAGMTASVYSDRGKRHLKDFLNSFASISVRENDSSILLSNLGIENQTVLDPTLLLDKKDWEKAIYNYSKCSIPTKKYILIYCLANGEYKKEAKLYASEHNFEVIDVLDIESKYHIINQFDFLKLISNSEYVFTDSYHCVIFSHIFSKQYKLFIRPDSDGRENRFNTLNSYIKNNKLSIDKEKEASIIFLKSALK